MAQVSIPSARGLAAGSQPQLLQPCCLLPPRHDDLARRDVPDPPTLSSTTLELWECRVRSRSPCCAAGLTFLPVASLHAQRDHALNHAAVWRLLLLRLATSFDHIATTTLSCVYAGGDVRRSLCDTITLAASAILVIPASDETIPDRFLGALPATSPSNRGTPRNELLHKQFMTEYPITHYPLPIDGNTQTLLTVCPS